jgi:hypothetical protein
LKHKIAGSIAAGAAALVLMTGTALAASYTLFGDAEIVSPGNDSPNAVQADGTTTGSGVDFAVPDGTTFADIDELSTDFLFVEGDCMAGSPRFQVALEDPVSGDTGNVFVYLGAPPAYTLCDTGDWANTGDLLEGAIPVDTSQLNLGTFYDPYATALLKYGAYEVVGISLVVDPGYGQVVQFDNTMVGETLYTYDQPGSKDQCKKGGWQDLTREDGTPFKNQGDCIQYFNTGK